MLKFLNGRYPYMAMSNNLIVTRNSNGSPSLVFAVFTAIKIRELWYKRYHTAQSTVCGGQPSENSTPAFATFESSRQPSTDSLPLHSSHSWIDYLGLKYPVSRYINMSLKIFFRESTGTVKDQWISSSGPQVQRALPKTV